MMQRGITERLARFVLVVVVSTFVLRWAYEQLRPLLPLLTVSVVLFGMWRVITFFRSRW